jgi:hypothetical protein
MAEDENQDVHVMQLLVLSEILRLMDRLVYADREDDPDRAHSAEIQATVRKTISDYVASNPPPAFPAE